MRAPHVPHVERHRKFQIIVSLGLAASFIVTMIDPALSMHAVVVNTIASFVWLWE
jgi:hypothetical protein